MSIRIPTKDGQPAMVFICGPGKGVEKKYACICCGWETDDIEQIAVNMCWDCVYGKPGCKSCGMDENRERNCQETTGSENLLPEP